MCESFVDAYIEVVDHTKGAEDTVRVTEEDYVALCKEAVATGAAPDGEDLGHLKAMLRLGVQTFVTDDGEFADKALKAGLEVFKTTEFIKLANRGQFFPRQLAKAC
jgi:predicted nucleic acid-binding protein